MATEQKPLVGPSELRHTTHLVVLLAIHEPRHGLASAALVVHAHAPVVGARGVEARTFAGAGQRSDDALLALSLLRGQQPILDLAAGPLHIEDPDVLREPAQDLAPVRREADAVGMANLFHLVEGPVGVAQGAADRLAQVDGVVLAAGDEAAGGRILPGKAREKGEVEHRTPLHRLRVRLQKAGPCSDTVGQSLRCRRRRRQNLGVHGEEPQCRVVVRSQQRGAVGAPADALREVVALLALGLGRLQQAARRAAVRADGRRHRRQRQRRRHGGRRPPSTLGHCDGGGSRQRSANSGP
mmetsp:Transcript_171214/g.548911  ORF Transcript_171214/g.548911 Transcript_171214/m.548911 type:complete len:297 (-) Transcript_171214:2-892(-)